MTFLESIMQELGSDALVKWDRGIEAHPDAHVFLNADVEWIMERGDANQFDGGAKWIPNALMLWTIKIIHDEKWVGHFAYWWKEDWFMRQSVPLTTPSRWSPPGFPIAFEGLESFQARLKK